jgi:tripartite-type tricarboxylate transporter receptor subunit TctC
MITRRDLLKSSAGAAIASPLVLRPAFAQDANWPTKEIKAVAMFPAGSGADIYIRFVAKKLGDELGRTIIVENRPGAFGNIANEFVARSKPDGYTIYIAPTNLLTIAPSLFKKLNYDPVKDFDSATTLFKLPFMLTVAGKSPHKTVADLVADLKKKGDKANYGSVSTVSLISAELFKQQFGLQTVEVKYKESAAAMNDLIGGNLDFVYIDPAGSAANRNSGAMRALCVTTKDRVQAMPDIPGSHEVGITNSDVFSWWSIHTPRGTPKAILDKLEVAGNKVVKDPETKEFLAKTGSDPFPGDAALAKKLLEDGVKKWGDWVKLAKVEPLG